MAETKNTFKLRELDSFLLKLERLALLILIIRTNFKWQYINEFTQASLVCLAFCRQRQLGIKSIDLVYQQILFSVERIWSAFIILSYWSWNFWPQVTFYLFVMSTLSSVFILWSMPPNGQKLQRKDSIHRETNRMRKGWEKSEMFNKVKKIITELGRLIFWLERLVIIAFILEPRSAPLSAVIFSACQFFHLICFLIPSDTNLIVPWDGELFLIERTEYLIEKSWQEAKLHVSSTKFSWNPFVIIQQMDWFMSEFVEKSMGEKSDTEKVNVEDHSPKEESNKRENSNGEQPEKERAKVEDDSPKEYHNKLEVEADYRLNKKSEVEEVAPEEENDNWEEHVVEADQQLCERVEFEEENTNWEGNVVENHKHVHEELEVDHHEAAMEQRDTWENLFFPGFSRFYKLQDMNIDSNSTDFGEEWRQSEEVSDVSGDSRGEIENDVRPTTAESVGNNSAEALEILDEVEQLNAEVLKVLEEVDEGERSNDENDDLKREKEVVEERTVSPQLVCGLECEIGTLRSENDCLKSENKVLKERLVSERVVLEASKRVWELKNQKLEAMLLEANQESAAMVLQLESHQKLEKDMAARLDAYQDDSKKWEQETRQIAAKLESLNDYSQILQKKCENEEVFRSLTHFLDALKHGEKALRDSEEKCRMLIKMNNMLVGKLQRINNSVSSNPDRVYELEEKCRMLEEDKRNLAAELLTATALSKEYRTLLHNLGC